MLAVQQAWGALVPPPYHDVPVARSWGTITENYAEADNPPTVLKTSTQALFRRRRMPSTRPPSATRLAVAGSGTWKANAPTNGAPPVVYPGTK